MATENKYDVRLVKVVDGDTVDVDIDLGFGIWLHDERVRIMGIDTPESRTRDKIEDLFGEAAKARVKELFKSKHVKLITDDDSKGEDMQAKFGRILGDFDIEYKNKDNSYAIRRLTSIMIEEGHAVAYFGGSKKEIEMKHMANREKLLREGVVDQNQYDILMGEPS